MFSYRDVEGRALQCCRVHIGVGRRVVLHPKFHEVCSLYGWDSSSGALHHALMAVLRLSAQLAVGPSEKAFRVQRYWDLE